MKIYHFILVFSLFLTLGCIEETKEDSSLSGSSTNGGTPAGSGDSSGDETGEEGCSEVNCNYPCYPNCPAIDMISVSGGTFFLGDDVLGYKKSVTINYSYEISKSEVTVDHYQQCVSDGYCTQAGTSNGCNTNHAQPTIHPQNCVSRDQMKVFAQWVGARLPTEAEWEYAGELETGRYFPWGNDNNTICSFHRANLSCDGPNSSTATEAVCTSNSPGNTPSGICDMVGNLAEWVLDTYEANHSENPGDGSANCTTGSCDSGGPWVTKGGSYATRPFLDHILFARVSETNASATVGARILRVNSP